MEKAAISAVLRKVVRQIVNADYVSVYESDQGKRILPDEIKSAIDDYPGKLTLPPNDAFNSFEDYGSTQDSENQIEFTLWYDGNPSDLTLSITIHKPDQYSLDDIRVM